MNETNYNKKKATKFARAKETRSKERNTISSLRAHMKHFAKDRAKVLKYGKNYVDFPFHSKSFSRQQL